MDGTGVIVADAARCHAKGRLAFFLLAAVFLAVMALLAAPSAAYAANPSINWTNGRPENSLPQTDIYIVDQVLSDADINGGAVHAMVNCHMDGHNVAEDWYSNTFSLKILYKNAGYLVDGTDVDMVLTFNGGTRLTPSQIDTDVNGDSNPDYVMTVSRGVYIAGKSGGTWVDVTTNFYKAGTYNKSTGTGTSIGDKTFAVYWGDIDVYDGDWGYRTGTNAYDEGIEVSGSNAPTRVWAGEAGTPENNHNPDGWQGSIEGELNYGERLNFEATSNGFRVRPSHTCGDCADSAVAFVAHNGFKYRHRVPDCAGSNYYIKSVTNTYPGNPTIAKRRTGANPVAANGTTEFTFDVWLPDVLPANQPNSVTISDVFNSALDVSGATVTVKKGSTDVTSNWTVTKTASTNTLTLAAKNTGHGYAVGTHTFTVKVPVRKPNTFTDDGLSFTGAYDLRLSNTVGMVVSKREGGNVSVGGGTVTQDISGYIVPATLLQKSDPDRGIGRPSGDASLAGAVYRIEYWPAWSASGNPSVTTTWTTDANGYLQFSGGSPSSGTWMKQVSGKNVMPWGTYRVTEVMAPAGYMRDSSSHLIYVRKSDASGTVYFEKDGTWSSASSGATTGLTSAEPDIIRGGVKMRKVDNDITTPSQGDASLAGAVFEVVNKSTNPVRVNGAEYAKDAVCLTLTTDANGYASCGGDVLPYGTYLIREKTPSTGYLKNSSWSKQFSIRTDGTIVDVTGDTCPETVIRGGIKVRKQDSETHEKQGDATLAGAVYGVRNDSPNPVYVNGRTYAHGEECLTVTTDASGVAASGSKVLPYGSYTVYEKTPSTGYLKNSTWSTSFTIRTDGTVVDKTADICNEDVIRGGVKMRKVDADITSVQGDASLSGAVYAIVNKSPSPVHVNGHNYLTGEVCLTITTNEQGIAASPQRALPYGTYEIHEKDPSTGYVLDDSWSRTFTVRTDGSVADLTGDPAPEDVIRGGVSLLKLDDDVGWAQGDSTLAGAVYSIVNDSPNPVHVNGSTYATGEECLTITCDRTGLAESDAHALPYGTYTVREKTPSEGYLLNTTWYKQFQVREDGLMVDITASISEEQVMRGSVAILKQDVQTGATVQGDATFAGAVFKVVNDSDQSVYVDGRTYNPGEVVASGTTNASGACVIGDLPYGSYTVYEATAPTGYGLPDPVRRSFKITADGQTVRFAGEGGFSEPVLRDGLRVQKVDSSTTSAEGDATLAGAVFSVVNRSSHPVQVNGHLYAVGEECCTMTTNASGIASVPKDTLPYGTYEVTEKTASTGYHRNSSWSVMVTLHSDGAMVDASKTCPEDVICGGVSIAKVDAETGRAVPQGSGSLAGARFEIVNRSLQPVRVNGTVCEPGRVVATMVTDASGKASIADGTLPYGTYDIREATAPTGYAASTEVKRIQVRATGVIDLTGEPFEDPALRTPVSLQKLDEDLSEMFDQGNGSLAGAVFEVVNDSPNYVYVGGRIYNPGDVVFCLVTDDEGLTSTLPYDLPVGVYRIVEVEAPDGYEVSSRAVVFDIIEIPYKTLKVVMRA